MGTRARLTALGVAGLSLAVAPAAAQAAPRIDSVRCIAHCTGGQVRGDSLLSVTGSGLATLRQARFRAGARAERVVIGRVGQQRAASARVRVPFEAVSGGMVLVDAARARSRTWRLSMAAVPVVAGWRCMRDCGPGGSIVDGSLLSLRGARLGAVRDGVVYNGRGRADDRSARVSNRSFTSIRMRVPAGAASGAFALRERRRVSPARRLKIAAPASPVPSTVPPGGIFPVRGAHTFGGAAARFGTGRTGHTHQGQDVLAACGTPLVAARGGTVRYAGYQASAAGYYIVISSPEADAVYMHMSGPAAFATGAVVPTGAGIGTVGETGNAEGCHLHFELWSPPGWYEGGAPFDPLPQLQAWDAAG